MSIAFKMKLKNNHKLKKQKILTNKSKKMFIKIHKRLLKHFLQILLRSSINSL